jgi:putative transcriptional regulator
MSRWTDFSAHLFLLAKGDTNMTKLNVLTLLNENGKTKYWLYKRLGMSYQNFKKMFNNETASIKYDVLEKICDLLNCKPNDLFKTE